jgi:hypothetical protein
VTSDAARKLSFSVEERALSRIFVPLYRDVPKDMPFFSTHPWTGHAAIGAGMTDVVTIVPDNYPIAFHIVEGSTHVVQSRRLHGLPNLPLDGHRPPPRPHDALGRHRDGRPLRRPRRSSPDRADCDARLRRIKDGETRRFL